MLGVIRYRMQWIYPILVSVIAILLAGCARDDDGFSIPFITVSHRETATWRIVVTGIDPVTASALGAMAGQQLLHRDIASSLVTDATPVDHILEIRITGVHYVLKHRHAADTTTFPPGTLDRLESTETVRDGANAALTIEQRSKVSVTETTMLANPNQDAVTLLADQVGELLSHVEPKLS